MERGRGPEQGVLVARSGGTSERRERGCGGARETGREGEEKTEKNTEPETQGRQAQRD